MQNDAGNNADHGCTEGGGMFKSKFETFQSYKKTNFDIKFLKHKAKTLI